MRDAAIHIRARPEQRDLIDRAAELLGWNRSDFMLEAACDRAQAALLDQVFFKLDAAKFRRFVKLLDSPPTANAGLKRLMAVEPPWVRQSAQAEVAALWAGTADHGASSQRFQLWRTLARRVAQAQGACKPVERGKPNVCRG